MNEECPHCSNKHENERDCTPDDKHIMAAANALLREKSEFEKEEDEKVLKAIDFQVVKILNEQWFDNMISGATASQETPIAVKDRDGSDLQIKITNAVIEYMIANRFMILKVGKDTFKQFLLLCSNGQDLAALKLIYSGMDTAALINQYRENAVKLAEIYKQDQDTKAFWLQMATTLGGKLISLALGSLI